MKTNNNNNNGTNSNNIVNVRSLAAKKAWKTIRRKRLERLIKYNRPLEYYNFDIDRGKVTYAYYEIRAPLIKPSKLTFNDGEGKELSDGYALNFAIGCTHACRFCYVDSIHKRFTLSRLNNNDAIARSWGMYLLIPSKESFEEALSKTPWQRWKGKEVMLSSTHDPYLPELVKEGYTRRILEESLPEGVRYCIQTRSTLVKDDFDLLLKYKDQIRLQYSIATLNNELARLIEPRVPSPKSRLNILKEASDKGLRVGVIVAPILPFQGWLDELVQIFKELSSIKNIEVYGESIHVRGPNMEYMQEIGLPIDTKYLPKFDKLVGDHFNALLTRYGLKGRYWYEYSSI